MKGRVLPLVLGTFLLVLGLASLNYTRESNAEHHREWAARHDMPPPSRAILVEGLVSTVLGALTIGVGLAKRRPRGRTRP